MSTLDELFEKIKSLPQKELTKLIKETEKHPKWGKKRLWVPNPGGQTLALNSPADELFYGGTPGCGKSALLIGTAICDHKNSIIFRREYQQIKGLEQEAQAILGSREGYNAQDHIWRIPGTNKVMEFGSVPNEADVDRFQGRAHDLKCVALGTRVLMHDGSYKNIENIEIGDFVATLDGPRKVELLHHRYAESVEVVATINGDVIARQIQGETHKLLTPDGWVSHRSEPTEHRSNGIVVSPHSQECGSVRSDHPSSPSGQPLQKGFLIFPHQLVSVSQPTGTDEPTLLRDQSKVYRSICEIIRSFSSGIKSQLSDHSHQKARAQLHQKKEMRWTARRHRLSPSPCRNIGREIHLFSSVEPTALNFSCKYVRLSSPPCVGHVRSQRGQCVDPMLQTISCQDHEGCQSWLAKYAVSVGRDLESDCAASAYRSQEVLQPVLCYDHLELLSPFPELTAPSSERQKPFHAKQYDLSSSSPVSYQDDYLLDIRLYDGLLPSLRQEFDLYYPRLLNDAGQQIPSRWTDGESDNIRRYIHLITAYPHPYRMEIRSTSVLSLTPSLSYSTLGKMHLYDLTVEEANHYITEGGFINKNCFDEAAHFSKSKYKYLTMWLRSTDPSQRCRIIAAGNPPQTAEGLWIIEYWAPWLDPNHPDPAAPGELRWPVAAADNSDAEIFFRSQEEAIEHAKTLREPPVDLEGNIIPPRSRSFIPGKLEDNPSLARSGYGAVLAYAPKSLKGLASGRFDIAFDDHPNQLIPTYWIDEAQKRWTKRPPSKVPMMVMGVDVAGGGPDNNVIAYRHDWWFAELMVIPGKEAPLPSDVVAQIIRLRKDEAVIVVDCGGGYGGGVVDQLYSHNGIDAIKHLGVYASRGRSLCKTYSFANRRAEVWWRFREALDPEQVGGSPIALPPDSALKADLSAPRFENTPRGIKIESKPELKVRLGRSPDRGDAVVMCWSEGQYFLEKKAKHGGHKALPTFAKMREGPLNREKRSRLKGRE